ncbi:OmpA family protein [Mucilaginibacter jinjuensis]|uniref:OmpA family protein n=1 Tax=Mucilaginibacter jinjuensis TaxID=1176721 RepID=A0ABY7T1Q0_9SPHI|nr:OmpA family protein [Mucilaginibacter jinjuensis]WCT10239.1 OmpA family protein [Mucilaginibacter jinjuensis]
MKKILSIILSLFCLLWAENTFAQYTTVNFRAMGDKAFRNKDYYEAAYYYRKAAEGLKLVPQIKVPFTPDNNGKQQQQVKATDLNYIRYQLAESYRGYENYLEAEPWYYQVVNENAESQYPLVRLWYGVCLRADQHFDEAIKQLEMFQHNYKGDGKLGELAEKEIRNCRFAKEQYQYPILLNVTKLKGKWNSDGSNYAVVRRDNNFYFTSSRMIKSDKKHLNRIYHATPDMESPEIVNLRDADKEKETEYGTPSLSPQGNRLYLTRWYKIGTKIIHAIYKSDWNGSEWSSPQKLNSNVNADGFNAIQPFVCKDGKTMFFVSNKPGGQGGDDIWMSELDSNGNPISSINLGSTINTPSDEQAPYYDEGNKRLIYSSKGFIGLGGFDFFESIGQPEHWSQPRNMGYPMNSAKDDLYFSPDPDNDTKFYVSSDRESDCCLELFEIMDQRYFAGGFLVDCNTHKPLGGAMVTLIDSLSKENIKQITLAKDGKYTFKITTKRPYNLMFEKDGYFTKVLPLPKGGRTVADTLFGPDVCLQAFVVDKPMVINNILYDFGKSTLRPESETELNGVVTILKDNPKFKIELSSHTDSIGSDAYNDKLSQDRAQSCVDYIISKGIEDTRVFAKGYGKTKPIAPNSLPDGKDNPDGRQLNRRTEFTVLKTD